MVATRRDSNPENEVEVDAGKPDARFIEHITALNPYAGLSEEDADFMRQYEGKTGKKVVRKVMFASFVLCTFQWLILSRRSTSV
jgi:hypothetical protein